MSFIVKGIDLPKTGERVYAEIRPSGEVEYIAVTYDKDYTRSAKVERTNAIQIPKGHGRLIDADAIIKAELYDSENGIYIEKEMTIEQWFMFMKNDAPTILEAEEEK